MKQILYSISICTALSLPAAAQESEADEGLSLMERGARLFLEGLMQEVEPGLKELEEMAEEAGPALRGFMEEMGPAFADLLGKVEDFSAYHPPEILPNGDIILRRRTPEEVNEGETGEIDL